MPPATVQVSPTKESTDNPLHAETEPAATTEAADAETAKEETDGAVGEAVLAADGAGEEEKKDDVESKEEDDDKEHTVTI